MGGRTHKRPWLAAVLAIALPGLGHAYLRSWLRSLLWFWMGVLSTVLFVPEDLIAGVDSISGAMSLSANLPTEAVVALGMVTAFNAIDAYWQASMTDGTAEGEGTRCPNCGRQLDDALDLEFCHWCTEPLEDATSR